MIDDEQNPLWEEQKIDIVPTVVFYDSGKPLRRLDGRPGVGLTAKDLAQALAQVGFRD